MARASLRKPYPGLFMKAFRVSKTDPILYVKAERQGKESKKEEKEQSTPFPPIPQAAM